MSRQRAPLRLALRLVHEYQAHSSQQPARMCAYDESCSDYALRQLQDHGLIRGGWTAFRRYRSCTTETAGPLSKTVAR